jgi:hypothetical protein
LESSLEVSADYVPLKENQLIVLSSLEDLRKTAAFFKKPIIKRKEAFFVFSENWVYAFFSKNQSQTAQANQIALDPSFLDKLPWQSYASGQGEWIKADLVEAEKLREAIGFNLFLEGV